jgi:parallel beta-helix repeat protein
MKHYLFCAMALLLSTMLTAKTYYIKPNGSDANDGLSWENAKASIQDAVDISDSGDQIFAAQGTYNLTDAIYLRSGRNIYGGFAGTESSLAERPALVYGKTREGNATVLDTGGNSRVIYQSGNFAVSTTVDGFVIQNGLATNEDGGGVYLAGGGILNNVTLTGNVATGTVGEGGGTIGGRGGGVYANYAGRVSNCFIINNSSTVEGGGIAAGRDNSRTTVVNCLITNNTSENGGGVVSQFADIINCTITNNHATNNGGGMYVYANSPTVTNCIVWNNRRGDEVSQINGYEGNTSEASSYFATQGDYHGNGSNKMTLEAANTGNAAGKHYPAFVNPTNIIGYVSTFSSNYNLIFAADWRLTDNSACIDAGIQATATLNLPDIDLWGNPRIINNRIDMGAYEAGNGDITALQTIAAGEVKIYPNPVSDKLFIEAAGNASPVELYNLTGSLLLQTRDREVDLSGLASGLYLLKINDKTVKIIKK